MRLREEDRALLTGKTMVASAAAMTCLALLAGASGCASVKSFFAVDQKSKRLAPIHNPFLDYQLAGKSDRENIVLRTKKGDRAVEVELPGSTADMTDFVVPMSPSFQENSRKPASVDGVTTDDRYLGRPPSPSDREITYRMPQGTAEDEARRREIESALGVVPAEDSVPNHDTSYLAAIDHVKQLYRQSRYEAALLEVDELLKNYPTDPKLYEMRGTLFDRIGRADLANRSWEQSLRFGPDNESLKRFLEKRKQKRSLASP